MAAVNADCAILNSGTLRSDTLYDIGEFKAKDLKRILPYMSKIVVISVTGYFKKIFNFMINSKINLVLGVL